MFKTNMMYSVPCSQLQCSFLQLCINFAIGSPTHSRVVYIGNDFQVLVDVRFTSRRLCGSPQWLVPKSHPDRGQIWTGPRDQAPHYALLWCHVSRSVLVVLRLHFWGPWLGILESDWPSFSTSFEIEVPVAEAKDHCSVPSDLSYWFLVLNNIFCLFEPMSSQFQRNFRMASCPLAP